MASLPVQWTVREGGAAAMLAGDVPARAVGLAWLGQAGFAIRHGDLVLLIDPYLSDHLAEKYRGTRFPHVRMMRPPIEAAELSVIHAVLCTHAHGDHLDPKLLPVVARDHPQCRFVVPRAERERVLGIGVPERSVVAVDAGETAVLGPEVRLAAIPAAHETFKTNDRGEHHFLGFVLQLGAITLYHSGDCVPYDGLARGLQERLVDVALLPVNGRDESRRSHGILGNMTLEEAAELCVAAGIAWLVPHHFGMFEFNTVDPVDLADRIARLDPAVRCMVPDPSRHWLLVPGSPR